MEDVSDGFGGSDCVPGHAMTTSVPSHVITGASDGCPQSSSDKEVNTKFRSERTNRLNCLAASGFSSTNWWLRAFLWFGSGCTVSASHRFSILRRVSHHLVGGDCWMELDKLYHATVTRLLGRHHKPRERPFFA